MMSQCLPEASVLVATHPNVLPSPVQQYDSPGKQMNGVARLPIMDRFMPDGTGGGGSTSTSYITSAYKFRQGISSGDCSQSHFG